jgi:hypothetical protein
VVRISSELKAHLKQFRYILEGGFRHAFLDSKFFYRSDLESLGSEHDTGTEADRETAVVCQ